MSDKPSIGTLVRGLVRVALALGTIIFLGRLIDILFNVRSEQRTGLAVAGSLFVATGVLVEGLATRALWKLGIGTPHPADPPKKLVTAGPYRVSRNPLYLARLVVLGGFASLLQSPGIALLTLALFVGLNQIVVPREERRLAARHGPSYELYRSRVPRWLGIRTGDSHVQRDRGRGE